MADDMDVCGCGAKKEAGGCGDECTCDDDNFDEDQERDEEGEW